MLVIAKLCRLIGIDELHTGAIYGKMHGGKREVQLMADAIRQQKPKMDEKENFLGENWFDLAPIMPVASGGLYTGTIPALMKAMGNDIIAQFGGGCHGHKLGTIAGAKAIRQAVDAVMQGTSLERHARMHKELRIALKQWGKP